MDKETKRSWAIEDVRYRIKENIESLTEEFMQFVHNRLPAKRLFNVVVSSTETIELPEGSKSVKGGAEIYYGHFGLLLFLKTALGLIFRRKKHFHILQFETHGKKYEIEAISA